MFYGLPDKSTIKSGMATGNNVLLLLILDYDGMSISAQNSISKMRNHREKKLTFRLAPFLRNILSICQYVLELLIDMST